MKSVPPITMILVETSGRKLLVGKTEVSIDPDSFFVFTREGDEYRLQVVAQSGNLTDPVTLAGILPPECIDAVERIHAAQIAIEGRYKKRNTATPKKRPPNRKGTRAND